MIKGIQDMLDNKDVERCCELLRNAEFVLVASGSGISVDAGIDYLDTEAFERDFPGMVKLGFCMRAELMGYEDWSPELKWGYLAAHVNQVRFEAPPHRVYGRLLDLVREKDYFVITSNVDGMFAKNGFSEERIFTPQGDYAIMQCQKPCTNATWPTKPIIERILPAINPETQEVTDPGVLPHCPNCGGDVMVNVRGGHWFLEDPYVKQSERFTGWVKHTRGHSLLVIEIGAGFNTPGVIRWPMERIATSHQGAHLIRVNLDRPQVPKEIAGRSVTLKSKSMDAITAIWKAMDRADDRDINQD